MPVDGNVSLTITGVREEKLLSKVVVSFSPEVDTSALGRLNDLICSDPQKLFLLDKAVGGNPWSIETVGRQPKKGYEEYEIVKLYYSEFDKIVQEYKKFGEKYLGIDSGG